MLVNLHVKNLAIIDEVEVDFSDRMNVLTGETGAGKSIIIGSINLALGQKGPRDIIRKRADYALIELVFQIENSAQRRAVEELGLTLEEDTLVISRKIMPNRSVNRINGESVTLAVIRQVADLMIDIHGQNEQQSLLHSAKHREILDRYARDVLGDRTERMEAGFGQYQSLLREWEEEQLPEEERLREMAFLQYELEEISQAGMKEGEEEELAERYRVLSHGVEIARGLGEIYSMTGEGDSTSKEQIGHSLRILHKIAEYDEKVEEFCGQLSEIDSLLADFNRDISSYMDDFEVGGEQLQEVENRLDLVRSIHAKYGATVQQVEEYAQSVQDKLTGYQDYEARRAELDSSLRDRKKQLEELASQITDIRKEAAGQLEKEVTQALRDLNFLQVKFSIEVRPLNRLERYGADEVEFMISTNPGMDLKPLGEAASGGELSRIMLAVKAVLARHDEIPTLIFDEIDVGISGRTAQMVAEKMAYIGRTHQVICISHLAQIAAMADSHYLIEKESGSNETSTRICLLPREESVEELARILGGAEITDAVKKSAAEMKQLAEDVKAGLGKNC